MTEYLYHWTDRRNLGSIIRHGLHPAYHRIKREQVWACEARRVQWAKRHTAKRHGVKLSELVLIRIPFRRSEWKRSCTPGVWVTPYQQKGVCPCG